MPYLVSYRVSIWRVHHSKTNRQWTPYRTRPFIVLPTNTRKGARRDATTNNTPKPHKAHTCEQAQVGQDTAHAHAPRAAKGQDATVYTPGVARIGATQPTHRASGSTPRPLVRARPGCIGDHSKRRPEPWKQLMTGLPAHSPGRSHLPSSEAPQLEPQG